MPDSTRPSSTHPIARTVTFDGDGEPSARSWVVCPRTQHSVQLEHCAGCAHLSALTPGTPERAATVSCYAAEGALTQLRLRDPLRLPRLAVSDLMTRNVVCVRMQLSLDALSRLFLETGLHGVPVVDTDGRVLGIVNHEDLQLFVQSPRNAPEAPVHAGEAPSRSLDRCSVADVMLPLVFTITEHTSLTEAAALLVVHGLQRATVVSDRGEVVGIISASDILHWLAREDGYALPQRGE